MIELRGCKEGIVIESNFKTAKKNEKKLEKNIEEIVRFANEELECSCAINGTQIKMAVGVENGICSQDLSAEITNMLDLTKRMQNFLADLPEPQQQDGKEVKDDVILRKEDIEIALDSAANVIKEKLGEDAGMFIVAISGKKVAVAGNIHPMSALPLMLMANERVDSESKESA